MSDRLLANYTHSQFLLVWYTLVSCCLSIILLKHNHFLGDDSDVIMAIFSVIILVISLVITNLNFKERGEALRKHHVKLLEIYEKTKAIDSVVEGQKVEYYQLLEEVDNHKTIDDIYARMQNLKGLKSRIPEPLEKYWYYLYRTTRFVLLTFLYLLPLSIFIG